MSIRIHIQNPPGDPTFAVTPAQWEADLARSADPGALLVSFAEDDAGFATAIAEAGVLLTWPKGR